MPAKINSKSLNERRECILNIMKDYKLAYKDVMRFMQMSYSRVKNWRCGATFFTTKDEYLLLNKIKKYKPEFNTAINDYILKNFDLDC